MIYLDYNLYISGSFKLYQRENLRGCYADNWWSLTCIF